ncbi:hypothetical protein AYJ54_27110 [Bradyrhizobium centrolobii]|uniref:Methyl-accepting chemotaxis protein n=1 Tax=Bradyrhizobium centrolobii TaxID=1505087 RepID=A0A176YCU6_9BRAD|nr:hypothetical protein [Bradyrhizobium centrolobii]OAF02408.1 hypothetical protein AYJ54_27110 [Bradyrhizobium centrolobii]
MSLGQGLISHALDKEKAPMTAGADLPKVHSRVWTSNIASVSSAANETGRAATGVLKAAANLSSQSTSLTSEVDSFISQVRAVA